MTGTKDMTALTERFLDLWQDNVRAWATERDLLTPEDLASLLKNTSADAQDGPQGAEGHDD